MQLSRSKRGSASRILLPFLEAAGSSIAGPNAGNVLVGDGSNVTSSGGGNGAFTGTIYDDWATKDVSPNGNGFASLQTAPGSGQYVTVSNSLIKQAEADALAVSQYAEGLATTTAYTFASNISGSTTFTGNGGVNVIDANNITGTLTFSGGVNDFYVINLKGNLGTINTPMVLSGGVTANHILFNFLATTGNVFQTSGGGVEYGTYLATRGADFQFSNLNLTGSLINTAGHIQLVSGSKVTNAVPLSPVPEPQTYAMLLAGIGLIGFVARRRIPR